MVTQEIQQCALCENSGLERTRFFQRQLVTASDFTQDQAYFLEKLRRHNRLLHGWGVVCGAQCKQGQGNCEVVIEPGYVLGPHGDEIVIDREVTIDVCQQDLDGNVAGPCGQPGDPWCSNIRVDRRAGDKFYIAVRYAEHQDRPVRVMSYGCGCDPQECEYSRIRDSYVFRVLTKLPATYPESMSAPDSRTLWECGKHGRPCPSCPTDPWVILADITLGAGDKIAKLDCFAHRRYVVSFADFYFMCKSEEHPSQLLKVSSIKILGTNPDEQPVSLTDPTTLLEVPFELLANEIEVIFNADVDGDTVVSGNTFKVERENGEEVVGNARTNANTVRWQIGANEGSALRPGRHRVTLVGTGELSIRSTKGEALDGEPKQLPSGDDKPGGNFQFDLEVVSGNPPIA